MSTKHTPGPWKYMVNVGPTKALIVEGDGATIVELSTRTRDGRLEANARLIAAAPDLLAACEIALTNLAPAYSSQHLVIKLLRAVIAKAAGL